jgi:NADH-quinone oxidoreductase subunit M
MINPYFEFRYLGNIFDFKHTKMQCGIFKVNVVCCIIAATGVILCGAYSLWLYNRVIFGNIKITYTLKFKDLNFREFSILFALVIWVIFMGIYPTFFSNYIHLSVSNLSFVTFF